MSPQLARAADSEPCRTPLSPKETRASHLEKQHLKKGQDRSKGRPPKFYCTCDYCLPWRWGCNSRAAVSTGVRWEYLSLDDHRYISGTPSVVRAVNDGVDASVRSRGDANNEALNEALEHHVWEMSDEYRVCGAARGPSERVVSLEALLENAKPSKKPSSQSARVNFEVLPVLRRTISLDSSSVFDDTVSDPFSFSDLEHDDVYESDAWEILSDSGSAPVRTARSSYASVLASGASD